MAGRGRSIQPFGPGDGGGGRSGRRQAWAPDFRELDPDLVAEAHGLGLRVVPWTVNEPDVMAQLISWGVEGLCTDRPDLARIVMAEMGLALPPPYPRP